MNHILFVKYYTEGLIKSYGLLAVLKHRRVLDLLMSDRGRELLAKRYYALREAA